MVLEEIVAPFKSILMNVAIDIFLKLINDQIKEETLFELGRRGGMFVTDNAKDKLPDKWDSIEEIIESKIWALQSGFETGLDYDDKSVAEGEGENPPVV